MSCAIISDTTDYRAMGLWHKITRELFKLSDRWRYPWDVSIRRNRHAHQRLLCIEPLEKRTLMSVFSVTNTNNSGAGSLHQAILDANANTGLDTIEFNIAGAGVHTISPTSALPTITDAVILDGYTQPGASANTLAVGDNATLQIELSGASAPGGTSGLTISSNGSTIRGLVVNNWKLHGIYVTGSSNIITGCFIGTNAAGTAAGANTAFGVWLYNSGASSNLVGGATPGARNIISCNGTADVGMVMSSNNTVQGNYIGTNAAGTAALSNGAYGVLSVSQSTNYIGGAAAGAGNVISGHTQYGICLQGGPTYANVIQGNFIGTNAAGTAKLGNTLAGIYASCGGNTIGGISANAANVICGNGYGIIITGSNAINNVMRGNYIGTDATGLLNLGNTNAGIRMEYGTNTIGGATAGDGNTIAYNGGDGVQVYSGTAIPIKGNKIYSNTGLGINLGSDGVTANDTGDSDTGANNLQNYPVLTSAVTGCGYLTLKGSFNSAASSTFRIEVFASTTADSTGYGEGQRYLGAFNVTTDGSGNVSFTQSLSASVAAGEKISATATDSSGNTSEFALCATAVASGITVTPTSGLTTTEAGGTATFTVALNSQPTADVTIGLSSSDTTEGTVSPASLTFTTANWSTPQTVTATGADDSINDGDIGYSIVTAAASSADSNYNGLDAVDVSVTNIDNETATAVSTDHPTGSIYGQTIIFTATVSASIGAGLPTGMVQFQIDGDNYGSSISLTGGMAAISVSDLHVGVHNVAAAYTSDNPPAFQNSQSTSPLEENVTPAPLTITAEDKTKLYGAALPTLTASYTGFVNGDSEASLTTLPTLATAATAASHVAGNPYSITADGAADPDYNITYVAGTLTVTPASLTITADNKTKLYGAALPTLTASYTGFVNGDSEASLTTLPTLATTATDTSPPGSYTITVSSASSQDYVITYVPGTLTIHTSQNAIFLMPDPLDPTKQALYIIGKVKNEIIFINSCSTNGDVWVSFNGNYRGVYHPTSRIIVHGLAGNDYIGVSSAVALSAWIYGDDGNDVLWGGGGPNIISGGNGDDTLYGGACRSILIGGDGNDTLLGGIAQSILIGKSTIYDANDLALFAILNEWNSSANYETRINHIIGVTGGLNGSYFFNTATVHNEFSNDLLVGGNRPKDLFFKGLGDVIWNRLSDERKVSLI
jgi:hypothetical protein